MSTFVNSLRTRNSHTENGMVTNSSSLNPCVDLFFIIGAYRSKINDHHSVADLVSKLEAAHNHDPLLTRKMLFWVRDIRGGSGERETFRKLFRYMCTTFPQEMIDNIRLVPEYGRWDDIFMAFDTPVEETAMEFIIESLESNNAGLLAKWIPRTGGKVSKEKRTIAHKIRRVMEMTPKEFRKYIVDRTSVIETAMCKKDYSTVNYSQVPSVAMARYTNAFNRNDLEKFTAFKTALANPDSGVTINASAIYPYDIIKTLQYADQVLAKEQWKALPNYMEGNVERVLPVCDVSGSMSSATTSGSTSALDICISLGLYISERNEGPFKNAFVTFSENPELQYLTGDLVSRFVQLQTANWGMSTNLEATFNHILQHSIKNGVTQEEMPTCILIMSDMEFNEATDYGSSAMDMIKVEYEKSGYALPKVVFWNLNARISNVPVQIHDENTALISGFSPAILKSVLSGKTMTPESIMNDTLNSERYSLVK
jgi:hypothetical protein